MGEFHKATKEDVPHIAKMMAASFVTYPFVAHFLKDSFGCKEKELYFLEKTCAVLIKALMRKGVCFFEKRGGEVRAFCILSSIEDMKPSAWDIVSSGAVGLFPYLFKRGVLRFVLFYLGEAANVSFAEYEGAWYVHLFAVSPYHQGQALGSEMMNGCIVPYVRRQGGKRVLLSTNTEMALGFYTKNGFQIIAQDQIANAGEVFEKWDLLQILREEEAEE